jgi:hypothetical protein
MSPIGRNVKKKTFVPRAKAAKSRNVLADGVVVGRIMRANAAPVDAPWLWALTFEHYESHADARLRGNARGRDGGIREELARGAKGVDRPAGGSIQNDSGLPQGPTHLDLAGYTRSSSWTRLAIERGTPWTRGP